MPSYTCQRCLRDFTQKSHYTRHMNRKRKCQDVQPKITAAINATANAVKTKKQTRIGGKLNGYNFIEVCAGAGGLSKGFIDIGFTPLLLNDFDKHCVNTLELNHPGVPIHSGDMATIDLDSYINGVDVLMGGVPCQSFSQAGKRKGIKDERGMLMLRFIEMIDTVRPKVFLIENVKGLKTHNQGNTLQYILDEIEAIGAYDTDFEVLNANDYSVPQNRERLIIVGIRKDLNSAFKFPDKHSYKPVLRDVLTNCPTSAGTEYSKEKKALFDLIPEGGCWVDLPVDLQKEYMGKSYYSGGGKRGILKRLAMDKPSLTLLTSPSQKQTERCHPLHTRPLQILEYARIQTFPDDYEFSGSVNQVYKQIGNAVPVNLAKALATAVLNSLTDSNESINSCSLSVDELSDK